MTTVPEPVVLFDAPPEFKNELVERLLAHVLDEVDDLLTDDLKAAWNMDEYPDADFREHVINYVDGYLNISFPR